MSVWSLAVAVAILVPSQSAVTTAATDAALTARIETTFLFNEHLSPFNINTTTNDGVVTLSGGVRNHIQKDLAGELAASFEGVREVRNNITVVPDTKDSVPKRNWRTKMADKSVSASVRSRLLYHKQFKWLKLGVRTENGTTILTGVVDNAFQRQEIERITFETRGVKSVVNQLTIRDKDDVSSFRDVGEQVSDEFVEKRVESRIILNRHLSSRRVDVEIDDGVCILTGTVESEPEKQLAESIAVNTQGVSSVRNEIVVRNGITLENKQFEALEPSDTEANRAPAVLSGPRGTVTSTPLTP
jgi:hyperosmotically inducible periplasmic protein